MRVLVCGSRDWDNEYLLNVMLAALRHTVGFDLLIEGGAAGADAMARDWAQREQIAVHHMPADWTLHGKAAGPIRNQKMLDEGKPELVVAFSDHLPTSRGTQDMIRRAIAAKVPVRVFTSQGEIR